LERFRHQVNQLPAVEMTSSNSGYNGTGYSDGEVDFSTAHLRTDPEFLELMKIPLVAGRNFEHARGSDLSEAIIVNQHFAEQAGLENPIGQTIPFSYGDFENPTVIGVVSNYYYSSPLTQVEPLVMYMSPENGMQELQVKFRPGFTSEDLESVERFFRSVYPTRPFNYSWMEESNAAQLETEDQIQKLSMAGSLLAIFLASLGLLGIVSTHVRGRTKEVSIRKVNGASPWNIYILFSRKFALWLIVGFALGAVPAIWWASRWLNNYPNRVSLSWDIPAIAILICAVIFLTIITILLLRIMRLNPVRFLRSE
jgi:putative ABC transport system permease protein